MTVELRTFMPTSITVVDISKSISPDVLAAEALAKMETSCITTLVVEDNDKNVCGVIHLHDLLRAGAV